MPIKVCHHVFLLERRCMPARFLMLNLFDTNRYLLNDTRSLYVHLCQVSKCTTTIIMSVIDQQWFWYYQLSDASWLKSCWIVRKWALQHWWNRVPVFFRWGSHAINSLSSLNISSSPKWHMDLVCVLAVFLSLCLPLPVLHGGPPRATPHTGLLLGWLLKFNLFFPQYSKTL